MKTPRFQPKRYQLKKESLTVLHRGHPWIFRSHLSSATEAFESGQWLNLVDHENHTQGYGIYEHEGLIAIRILKEGERLADVEWWGDRITKALEKREPLRHYTDAFRAIHGENDRFPSIVVDVYGPVAVLQTYSPSVDSLGRWIAHELRRRLGLKHVVWKLPAKRKRTETDQGLRFLYGTPPGVVTFREGNLRFHADVSTGQKSGTFLDLRGLRKWIADQDWKGARVLNLFSYTGTLGAAAEAAGANEIWNVDISQGALDFSKKHHVKDPSKFRWVCKDIFSWLAELATKEQFDVIICDPPMMAGHSEHVPNALKTYEKTYRSLAKHLKTRGTIIGCCCTSRISRPQFQKATQQALGSPFKLLRQILPEDDHPVGFPQGDYLKILVYGRR